MGTVLERIEKKIKEKLSESIEEAVFQQTDVRLERNPATESEKGEIATPIAFEIGSKEDTNPVKVADKIIDNLDDIDYVSEVKNVSGYINFHFKVEEFSQEVLMEIDKHGEDYGKAEKRDELVILEGSSPNIAKPMHVGHLRNTLLWDSLRMILDHQGYEVVTDNHLGDWGSQFGNLIYAFKQWGDEEKLEEDPIPHLLDIYQKFGQKEAELEGEELEKFRDNGREWFRKLSEGDKEAEKLWKKFKEVSIKRFEETYDRLDIQFDEWIGESFYVQESYTSKVVEEGIEKDVFEEKADGSIYAEVGKPDPETGEKKDFVVLKSDGTTLYATRDLGTIKYRFERWNPDEIMYVVASEQEEYFQNLFETAGRLGYNKENLRHISYGMLSLPEGSMSTRRGRIISARNMLDEAKETAEEIVTENNPELEDDLVDEISEKIGQAALRFENLNVSREKDIVFNKDEALSFEGQTGPYIQYSYTRAYNILEDLSVESVDIDELDEEEYHLVHKLAEFPFAVQKSSEKIDSSPIANYTYKLANQFNKFYHEKPVINAETEEAKNRRAYITQQYLQVMESCLNLLRIQKITQM